MAKRYYFATLGAAAVAMLAACAGPASLSREPSVVPESSERGASSYNPEFTHVNTKIQHVVIIVQENRTVDDLFQFLPGANTQSYGLNLRNKRIPLKAEDLTAPYDIGHVHGNWKAEFNGGKMNGFDLDDCRLKCPHDPEYGYVPKAEVQPYYTLAETYAFADNFFQTNEGPSFPAHQYLISGTSTVSNRIGARASNNAEAPNLAPAGGCDSPPKATVRLITREGHEDTFAFPCFHRIALMNELDAAGLSWRYYQAQPGPGLWNAVDAIYSIWSNRAEYAAKVITPSTQFLTDVAGGKLAAVTWIMPTARASDHAGVTDGSGPSWVGSLVNAIGSSPYWNNTAIFITWDDWGGWYDHVKPIQYNSYELGFRVPLIVVSPYAKRGYVSHLPHEFGSILKFTERIFGLPTMHTTDKRSNDLFDCFDFTKVSAKFVRVKTKFKPSYFFSLPATEPDDE